MTTARLRKVGGSTILAIPPALLEELHVTADALLDLAVSNGTLVIRPARKRYTLDQLLAKCDPAAPFSDAEREWSEVEAVGLEALPEDTAP